LRCAAIKSCWNIACFAWQNCCSIVVSCNQEPEQRLEMDYIALFVQHFLAIYFIMVGVHYSVRSYALSERTGISHIGYGPTFTSGWWGRHVFNLFRATILVVCVARLFANIDPWLGLIALLYQPWILCLGVLCMLVSFAIIDYVHAYMHQDWRSGITVADSGQNLITTGPFSRSRNPLFIGILLGQFGFFLAFPSVFSLVCMLTGAIVIINQIRIEERYLQETFGEAYSRYLARVPRWL